MRFLGQGRILSQKEKMDLRLSKSLMLLTRASEKAKDSDLLTDSDFSHVALLPGV